MEDLNDIILFRENLGIFTCITCICTTAQEQRPGMCVHTWGVKLTQVFLAVLYLIGKVWNNPRVLQWKTSEIKHRMEYYGVNFKMG